MTELDIFAVRPQYGYIVKREVASVIEEGWGWGEWEVRVVERNREGGKSLGVDESRKSSPSIARSSLPSPAAVAATTKNRDANVF